MIDGTVFIFQEPKVVAKLQEEVGASSILIFEIGIHPLIFRILFGPGAQVDSVLGDRFPTIEDMTKLKYTTRVINEVRSDRFLHENDGHM